MPCERCMGMFSTHSSVAQLKPDTVFRFVSESEEQIWGQTDLPAFSGGLDTPPHGPYNLGSMLLSQSPSIRKIHSYFSQLESRKCCLHLACKRSAFSSLRVVPSGRSRDDGSAKKRQLISDFSCLEPKELRTFKHAYLCAVYPVLAAPDPPSPTISPAHIVPDHDISSAASKIATSAMNASLPSTPSPNSLHDSGMEESEEAGMIPMESLCEHLRRSFVLTHCVFQQYESIIVKTYSKKSSPQKKIHPFTVLLAEELSGQLALLETNNNPFYNPSTFVTQNGYDSWQKQERSNISKLLGKFWQSSLPHSKETQDLITHLNGIHEHYAILVKKLITYERQCKQENDLGRDSFTQLSSTSNRLLMEFGLRFGIGETYRKVVMLDCLTQEFSLSVGYLSLVHNLVLSIHHMLPSTTSAIVMVKKELEILQTSLRTLKVQTCKALSQMKRLFPGNKPAEGIELLMSLLKVVLSLMKYLAAPGVNVPLFESCLKMTVQSIFQSTYELFKTVSRNDVDGSGRSGSDPRLLNILIQDIREDVTDYRNNFEETFQDYFSISRMAAKAYYQLLMDDVKFLTDSGVQHRPMLEIDLRMLALSYRLNQLDSDWKQYIPPQKQTWRAFFVPNIMQLTSALRLHLQNLVLEAVSSDKFTSQNLNLPMPFSSYQSLSSSVEFPSRSVSAKSITPSLNSAFSSIISSARRTPTQQDPNGNHVTAIKESIPEHENELETPDRTSCSWKGRRDTSHLDSWSLNLNKIAESKDLIQSTASRRYSLPECLESMSSQGDGLTYSAEVNRKSKNTKIKRTIYKPHVNNGSEKENSCDSTDSSLDKDKNSHKNDAAQLENKNLMSLCQDNTVQKTPSGHNPSSSFRAIQLVPNSEDKKCPNHENSDSDEKEETKPENGDFEFPPLKLDTADFSLPVFTKPPSPPNRNRNLTPTAQTKCNDFILRAEAPASISSRASSMLDNEPGYYTTDNEQSDSLESNISFPVPPHTQAMLPISGSTVDLIVILQRLCSFSRTLVSTIITNSPFIVDNSSPSKTVPLFRSQMSLALSSGKMLAKDFQSSSSAGQHGNNNGESGLHRSQSQHQFASFSNLRDGEDRNIANAATRRSAHISATNDFNSSLMEEDSNHDFPLFDGNRIKIFLHFKILKAMCNMLVIYTSNMLCMDLCGTPRNVAIRLIGPKLLELTESQQKGGLIWGCRHQAEDSGDCLFYLNRKTSFLCDRYEPVTQYMCTRINNVFATIQVLEDYREKLVAAMKVDTECKTPTRSASPDGLANSFAQGLHDLKDSRTSESSEFVRVNSSGRFSNSTVGSGSLDSNSFHCVHTAMLKDYHASCVHQAVEATQQHCMAVLTATCRLIAYKLNLFVRDGLPLLLHLKSPKTTVATAVEPITSFLQKYLDSMSTWLYRHCFRRVLDSLWVLMVQDFETQAEMLMKKGASAYVEAHNWMLAISHLIKFMNNSGRGIKKELLLSQANDVIFRFQLFTLSTGNLMTLYTNLKDYQYTEGDHLTLEESRLRCPPSILHRIHHELQMLKKCFTGAELIRWIMKNKDALPADLALPPGPVVRDTAVTISQILLDQQFIVDLDSEMYTRNQSPLSFSCVHEAVSPYPQLSIHSQSYKNMEVSGSLESAHHVHSEIDQLAMANDSDHSTPQASPQLVTAAEVHQDADTNLDSRSGDSRSVSDNVKVKDHEDRQLQQDCTPTNHRVESWMDTRTFTASLHDEVAGELPENCLQRSLSKESHDSGSLFNDSQRQTPFSSLASLFTNNSQRFVPSTSKYYMVPQSILNSNLNNHVTSESSLSTASRHRGTSQASQSKRGKSRESLVLLEKCVVHKISPLNLVTIIAARRKTDSAAKNFIKKVPSEVRDRAFDLLDEPFMGCRTS